MMVYRVVEKLTCYCADNKQHNEYKEYLDGIISIPKEEYNHGFNTHIYKENEFYLHFFHYIESVI